MLPYCVLRSVCLLACAMSVVGACLLLETQNAVTGVLCDVESLRVNTSTFLRGITDPLLSIANNTRGATARVAGRVGKRRQCQGQFLFITRQAAHAQRLAVGAPGDYAAERRGSTASVRLHVLRAHRNRMHVHS